MLNIECLILNTFYLYTFHKIKKKYFNFFKFIYKKIFTKKIIIGVCPLINPLVTLIPTYKPPCNPYPTNSPSPCPPYRPPCNQVPL